MNKTPIAKKYVQRNHSHNRITFLDKERTVNCFERKVNIYIQKIRKAF